MSVLRELTLAEQSLAAGDKKHAAHHAANALALVPSDVRAQALVDSLLSEKPSFLSSVFGALRSSKDPAPLFPEGDFYGYAAVRARAHWRNGDLDRAFSILAQIQVAVPHIDYGGWLLGILDAAAARRHPVEPSAFYGAFGEVARPFIGLLHLREGERAAFATWAEIGARLARLHEGSPAETRRMIAMCAAGMLRRAGRYADSLEAIDAIAGIAGDDDNVLAQRGLALRALGRFGEARQVFFRAAEITGDVRHRYEAARAHYDQREYEEALTLFTEAPTDDQEILLAADACRRALDRPLEREDVKVLFAGVPTYDELRRLLRGDASGVRMTDATTNGLSQFAGKNPDVEPPIKIRIHVSSFESPSVLLTLALFTKGSVDTAGLSYEASARPERNPIEPLAPDGARLWREVDGFPRPLLEPPPDSLKARIEPLAGTPPPAMTELVARARACCREGPAIAPEHLLAAMTHPPPIPKGRDPAEHVFAWQRACALILSALDPDRPWLASARRDNLRKLVLGPPDWTTAAGLIALAEVLLDEPEALADAREWLDVLVAHAPSDGHCPWATALGYLHAFVPGLRRDLLQPLAAWLEPS